MKTLLKTLGMLVVPFIAFNVSAEPLQDCLLKGTVDKKKAEALGQDVYVAFHQARRAVPNGHCRLNSGEKLAFSDSSNSMIAHAPHGAVVSRTATRKRSKLISNGCC